MTSKHQDPQWRRTVKLIRSQVAQAYARGDEVLCWRCGQEIPPGTPYDVGHIDRLSDDNSVENAAPEHRTQTGKCVGNRNHGGHIGASITNLKKGAKPSTFKPLSWA